jgi:putative aldouronate transport system substrate-binding protein
MKTWNRKMVTLVTLTMACGCLLVACSKESGSESTAAPSGTTTGTAAPAKKGNITVTLYDRGNIPQGMGTIDNNRWTKWVNETGPAEAKFVPIPRGESVQKLNILFASGSAPDVIQEFDTNFRDQLYQQKQIMPVDDLIQKYSTTYKALMQKYPELKKAGSKSDGKQYEFGRVQKLVGFQALFIREDWLKKLGLKAPETVEELFKVAQAFTDNDPDGNGKKDTYGISLSGETGGAISTMFQDVSWVLQDGKLVHDWDRAKAAVTFKKQLFDAGLTDKDFLTDKNGQKAVQDWINGKTGIFVGRTILEVTDFGRGINTKDLPRIFDKGFTSTTWHQDSAATGMGLYLARKAADTLHVQITVHSEVGVGTTFTLAFPQPNELVRITGM